MFSKAIVFLVLAASAIAGPIAPGTYRITNVASQSTARASTGSGQISVSSEGSNPGPYELWNLRDADNNGYIIENVGLGERQFPDRFAAVPEPRDGAAVLTYRYPTAFNIEFVGDSAFVIKLQNNDLLWNVEPPVTPTGAVVLRPADGASSQKWVFSPVEA